MAAKKMTVNGATYNLTALADGLRAGTKTEAELAAKSVPAEVVAAAMKLAGKQAREAQVATVYGSVVRRTDKAVLFAADAQANNGAAPFAESWFPLSQVTVLERALGGLDAIRIPAWLLAGK